MQIQRIQSVLQTLLQKGTDKEEKQEQKVTERPSRRLTKTPSYKEQSSDENGEEKENKQTAKPRIVSSKRIDKKLKVIVPRLDNQYCQATTFAFGDNSPSPILANEELEGVMQPSPFQVIPKQLMEDDNPSGESSRAAE